MVAPARKSHMHERTFSHVRSHFALDKKAVLDIGSSEGHYLERFGEGSMGVTIIPEHVTLARQKGLNVIQGNIEDPAFTLPEKFDAIWANNLLEHLHSPHLFLTHMREFLNPGGVLILGVPVLPPPFLQRLKKFRGAFAASHINFFTRRTLIETARAAGWIVADARSFHFANRSIDSLITAIAPHIYIVARPDPSFAYARKRLLSLQNYEQ